MTRDTIKQAIVEHLETASGLSAANVHEEGPSLQVFLGFPTVLRYHYTWNGERYRFCCAGLVHPNAWTGVGIEAARKAAMAGKGAG